MLHRVVGVRKRHGTLGRACCKRERLAEVGGEGRPATAFAWDAGSFSKMSYPCRIPGHLPIDQQGSRGWVTAKIAIAGEELGAGGAVLCDQGQSVVLEREGGPREIVRKQSSEAKGAFRRS